MPELPEVETVRRGLQNLLPGRQVVQVDFDFAKGFPNAQADIDEYLIGAKIKAVKRRAKVLIIDLDTNYSLVIHLKMTGQLVFRSKDYNFGAGHPNDSLLGKLPDKSTRVTLTFGDNGHLFFNDQRKFGWMRLLPAVEIPEIDFFKKVGPEPLSDEFLASDFIIRLRRRNKSAIKSVLLDQTVIAGVGNIYADESLFAAQIHPLQKVCDIDDDRLKKLYDKLRFILNLSLEKGGSTDKNYVDAEGKKGSYLEFAKVFRRQGQTCGTCKSQIIKIRAAGRGTHICPKCQVLV